MQLRIARPVPRDLTLVEKELAGGHGTKLGGGHRGQFLLQALKGFVPPVAMLFVGCSRTAALAGERQVRTEGVGLPRHIEPGGDVVDGRGKRCEFGARLDSNPKNAGRFWRRKETVPAEGNVESGLLQRAERLLESGNHGVRFFADKL